MRCIGVDTQRHTPEPSSAATAIFAAVEPRSTLTVEVIGMAVTVFGVAIVNHPRAEDTPVPTVDPEEHLT